MNQRQLKIGYFVLEGLNAFATTYFFSYLFFHMHDRYGTGNAGNLGLSALNGLVYMAVVWFSGQLARRIGYYVGLGLGFGIMAVTLAVGSLLTTEFSQYFVVAFWTAGMSFTWPILEALASENETAKGLQQMVGIYNVVWATASASAYFLGGALIAALGNNSLYWLPVGLHVLQLALLYILKKNRLAALGLNPGGGVQALRNGLVPQDPAAVSAAPSRPAQAETFLRIAWVINPFAYVAINSVLPVIPDLAHRLNLSMVFAGFFCSIWYFARLAAFYLLWQWSGWHYRFRWMLGGYLLLIGSFLALLTIPHLWVVVLAQIIFGFGVGLAYYSSLYYSMDIGEASSSHGGIHEAAIGAGVFVGPAVGATTLHFLPQYPGSNAWAVSTLLLCGAAAILVIRRRAAKTACGKWASEPV